MGAGIRAAAVCVSFRTDIQRRVFLRGEIVDVGDAEGLDGGLPDPSQHVPQEHVDPHGQVGLALTACRRQHAHFLLSTSACAALCPGEVLTSVGHVGQLASAV